MVVVANLRSQPNKVKAYSFDGISPATRFSLRLEAVEVSALPATTGGQT